MGKSSRFLRIAAWLLGVLLAIAPGACSKRQGGVGDPPGPAGAERAAAPSGDAENPDRGRFIDLREEPFRSGWVGGTLTVGLKSAPSTLNNLFWTSPSDGNYQRHFLNPPLLIEGPDVQDGESVHPHASEILPVAEDGFRRFVFRLREGFAWESGRPVVAADYAETLDLLRDPGVPCAALRARFADLDRVEAPDDRTVVAIFKEPSPRGGILFGLDFRVMPAREIAARGKVMDPRGPQAGFGPYRVESFADDHVLFALREAYRTAPHPLGPRYVERVRFRFVSDGFAATTLLREGQLDLLPVDVEQFLSAGGDAQLMERVWRASYYLPMADLICWNLRNPGNLDEPHPVLGDPRVRRGLSHLLQREGILNEREGGLGVVHDGPFDFRDPGRDPDIPPTPFSPARAAALFDEAGFLLEEDGVRRRRGTALRFSIHVLEGRSYWIEPLEHFRREAGKAGVLVELKVIPSGLGPLVDSRRFDAFIALTRATPMIAPDLFPMYHSSMAGVEASNWSGVEDGTLDSILDRLRRPLDPQERIREQRMLHRRFLELQPLTFLYSRPSCILVSRRFANVKVHDLGIWYQDFVLRSLFEAR